MFDCSVLTACLLRACCVLAACLLSVRFGDDGGGDELPSVDHASFNKGPCEKYWDTFPLFPCLSCHAAQNQSNQIKGNAWYTLSVY